MEKIKNEKGEFTVKNSKENSGITLVALVVTIVVLLILAGITINLLFSDNGIINKAQNAADETNKAVQEEQQGINNLAFPLNNVIGGTGTTPEETITGGNFDSIKGVNTPKLGNGMIPVKYSGTEWVVTTTDDKDWYKYTTTEKQWANIMLTDRLKVEGITDATTASLAEMKGKKVTSLGSMYVWIPRYAYQIANNYHTNIRGTINIKFLKGTSDTASDGTTGWNNSSGLNNWNIHPAFDYGEPTSGIWVAKFEASQSNAGANTADYQNYTGGTSGVIKIQPGVNSWRNISVNDIYTKCLNYNTTLNSHMMKNSEWGACAYLAQSSYGKNSEVWINPNSNYITGQAGTSASAGGTTSTYSYENTTYGVQASTTGNVYGIYDMSGGSWEYTAAYVNNGHENLTKYGASLVSGAAKTKDVYTSAGTSVQQQDYNTSINQYGHAVYETSKTYSNSNGSWYGVYSIFPYSSSPFFPRGGCYNNTTRAGTFCFFIDDGAASSDYGFRPVLIVL